VGKEDVVGPAQGFHHMALAFWGEGGQERNQEESRDGQGLIHGAAGQGFPVQALQQGEALRIPAVARQQMGEQTVLLGRSKNLAGHPVTEQLQHLVPQTGRRGPGDQRSATAHPLLESGIQGEIEAGRQLQGAQHAHRILLETGDRVTDDPQPAGVQILDPAHMIDDGEGCDIVEQGVDGEVAAEGVLARRSEDVLHEMEVIAGVVWKLLRCRRATEGGHLHHLVTVKTDMGQPETPSHQKTVAEQTFDLRRGGVGADVEILGRPSQEQVPHAPPHQIGEVVVAAQTMEDLKDILVDEAAGDAVLVPGDDAGLPRGIEDDGIKRGGIGHGRFVRGCRIFNGHFGTIAEGRRHIKKDGRGKIHSLVVPPRIKGLS
jgi:hypothetical protein